VEFLQQVTQQAAQFMLWNCCKLLIFVDS